MSLHTEWVRYGTDQTYTGYLAKPARAEQPLAAVVVIQEIWGVDGHIQDLVRRFAQAGYVAFAPDLYSRNGQRPAPLAAERVEEVKNFLDSVPPGVWHSQEERQAAIAQLPGEQGQRISETFATLFGGLEYDRHIAQLLATTAWLRETCPHSQGQPVVSVGFCMGGALSVRLACADAALRGAVIFYGQAPEA
ncbi:MAG: dienelactone hydrolase family protein, partial [Alicyclobacillus sp.]|nr:dienelactone hydrolase family protein [Alicyclobacillus sp.]